MANGKSLAPSLADMLFASLLSADRDGAAPEPEGLSGACSDMGCDKSVTSWNPSPAHNSDYSPSPSICGLRPWWRLRPHEREPSPLPEYPRRDADCPRIFYGAPAWVRGSSLGHRQPSPCTRYSRFRPTCNLRLRSPSSLCC